MYGISILVHFKCGFLAIVKRISRHQPHLTHVNPTTTVSDTAGTLHLDGQVEQEGHLIRTLRQNDDRLKTKRGTGELGSDLHP